MKAIEGMGKQAESLGPVRSPVGLATDLWDFLIVNFW